MAKHKTIRVHLVEQDRPVKMLLEREVLEESPSLVAIHSGAKASDLFAQQQFDTTLDFQVPGFGRVETQRLQTAEEDSDFVLIDGQKTNLPNPENALPEVDILSGSGAMEYQFLTKPLSASDLGHLATEIRARQEKPTSKPPQLRSTSGHKMILCQSETMLELLDIARRVAAGAASILIQGETGTGKTLIARYIHASSPRADKRFVAINCSAFQDQLLESELFGHEKGSFTGATTAKPGLFEVAHQGTLFLDEVGDMTSAMQAKLLQVLDDGELRRVGGTKSRRVDTRILAASNKDLQEEVKAGRFREDLFFRLNVIRLQVPHLRERPGDIQLLVQHFLDRFKLPGRPAKTLDPEAMRIMSAYSWPGNVRELANTIEGLVLLAPGQEIKAADLPPNLRPTGPIQVNNSEEPLPLSAIERQHIARALKFTEGKKAPAARLLGIDVKTLRSKIRSFNLE